MTAVDVVVRIESDDSDVLRRIMNYLNKEGCWYWDYDINRDSFCVTKNKTNDKTSPA